MGKNSFKYFDAVNGRILHGNAAFLKIVSEAGGADAFVEGIASKAIIAATPIVVAEIFKKIGKRGRI